MKRIQRMLAHIHWKKVGLYSLIIVPSLLVCLQFFYPYSKTMLYTRIDTVDVGGLSYDEAAAKVADAYQKAPIDIYFGKATKAYRSPSVKTLGATVATDSVKHAGYPWWLRLVPTSLWWGHVVVEGRATAEVTLPKEKIASYVTAELGESCNVAPTSASVTVKNDKLVRMDAEDGGTCKLDDVVVALTGVDVTLEGPMQARIAMQTVAPKIRNEKADELIRTIEAHLQGDIALHYDDASIALQPKEVRSWLVFDNTGDELVVSIDPAKAGEPLTQKLAEKVAIKPGVVTITTSDFVETARSGGGVGRALNTDETIQHIRAYLLGENDTVQVATTKIEPQKKYIRSYSPTDTGLSALIQHYAETHTGVYGVSLIELSGKGRIAGYNQTKNFFPASTYKVLVAYSTLRQVEAGKMSWTDQIQGGRNLAKCFDDMIVLSDNPCAETLTLKIGVSTLNADLAALGLTQTRFVGPGQHRATAGDLSRFMANLERGQLSINSDSRSRLLNALGRNVYRRGIPAGASGSVFNKVGFIDALLHDTAIVHAPSGTYVLTIMTDGSSWSSIAALTREIEKLRVQ